jgi:hypothetical protein
MQIKILSTFMSGRDRFVKDEVREVSEEIGLGAVANGWAEDVAGRVATGNLNQASIDIIVDKSNIGVGDSNG